MSSILGRLAPAAFMRDYWQQRPLLIRQALPGFGGILDRDALLGLAMRPDATSRLVIEHPRRKGPDHWERHDGPFGGLDATMLPKDRWTLLVHGVESLVPGGWELLRHFSFLPAARIDDLMVSYAAPGGSVGPHEDRYDVFLLQGPGRRRWQLSERGDHALDPTAKIKVLESFVPEQEWLLEPGDMLYLPPSVAHYGVAEDACFTYSIGFLAPSHEELAQSFLGYLGHALAPRFRGDELLGDGDRAPARSPLALPAPMIEEVATILDRVRWDRPLVERFLGCFLTRPKPHVAFVPPARPLSPDSFVRRLADGNGRDGRLRLALPSRGLVQRGRLFFNGEAHDVKVATLRAFESLVSDRSLALPRPLDAAAEELFYGWYLAGYLGFSKS
jgi:50S ribosomal protein L16 3-hydroxylase